MTKQNNYVRQNLNKVTTASRTAVYQGQGHMITYLYYTSVVIIPMKACIKYWRNRIKYISGEVIRNPSISSFSIKPLRYFFFLSETVVKVGLISWSSLNFQSAAVTSECYYSWLFSFYCDFILYLFPYLFCQSRNAKGFLLRYNLDSCHSLIWNPSTDNPNLQEMLNIQIPVGQEFLNTFNLLLLLHQVIA